MLKLDGTYTDGKFTGRNKTMGTRWSRLTWEYNYMVNGKQYFNYSALPQNFEIHAEAKYSVRYSKHCPEISGIELDHPINEESKSVALPY